MATYYVDKYASGAADGTSWTDAITGVGSIDNISGITASDTVLIKSYGPDDPYTDKDADVGGRYIFTSNISGVTLRGDDGQGDASIPSPKLVYIEGDGATIGAAYGCCKCYNIAMVNMTVGFFINAGTVAETRVTDCVTIGCVTRGIQTGTMEDFYMDGYSSYNDAAGARFSSSGVSFDIKHVTFYGDGGTVTSFTSTCDAASITMRDIIHLNCGTNSIEVDSAGQFASGSPDYIHTDQANHAALFAPDTVPTGSNNVFGVTAADYLPYAGYGILYPSRGFPGAGEGHDGLDVGAHHLEYAIECLHDYSCDIDDGTPTRAENQATHRVGLSTNHWRTIMRFDISRLPPEARVLEMWLTLYINTLSTGAAAFRLFPYAGLGYSQDPETDGDSSLANAYAWADDGPPTPAEVWISDAASTGSTGQKAYLLEPDRHNTLIEEARRKQRAIYSIGLRQQDETVDDFLVDGRGSATESRKPRIIVVYSPGLTELQKLRAARNILRLALGAVG